MSTQLQKTESEDILSRINALEPVTLIPVGIVISPVKKPVLRANEEGLSQEEQDVDVTEHHRKRKKTISEIWNTISLILFLQQGLFFLKCKAFLYIAPHLIFVFS